MDITIPPVPAVAPEVLRVAEHRHKKGLMYPYIYHVLTKVRGSDSSRLMAHGFCFITIVFFIFYFTLINVKLKNRYIPRKHL